MTRDSDIPTIFNPRRGRTPSVLITGEEGVANGPFSHADSINSQQEPGVETQSSTTNTGFSGKVKSCTAAVCSQSARKVSLS